MQNFWLKKLTALHPLMAKLCNTVAREPSTAPSWLTCGRTTLIHKKGPTDVATNYRPITCLPTIYKLMTLLMTDKIYSHVTDQYILPFNRRVAGGKHVGARTTYSWTRPSWRIASAGKSKPATCESIIRKLMIRSHTRGYCKFWSYTR